MSSIMKGIVDESEEVAVIYIDGKPSAKYAKKHEAERDAEFMRERFPKKKIEIKHEVRETEAKKGADGKRCWKGKRYAGTENGKDKCIPVKKANEGVIVGHDANDPEVAILGGAGTMSLSRLKKKAQGEAEQLANDLARGRFKAAAYNIKQLENTLKTIAAAEDEMEKGYFGEDYTGEFAAEKTPAINPYGGLKDKQHRGAISETPTDNPTGTSTEGGWRRTDLDEELSQADVDAIARFADKLYKKLGIDVTFTKHFMDRVNDERNGKPISGAELVRLFKKEYERWGKQVAQLGPDVEGTFKDLTTDINLPFVLRWDRDEDELDLVAKTVMRKKNFKTWNKEFPVDEDTSYAGGMGQGGNAGESYRKFKPKSAGTFKEEQLDEGIRQKIGAAALAAALAFTGGKAHADPVYVYSDNTGGYHVALTAQDIPSNATTKLMVDTDNDNVSLVTGGGLVDVKLPPESVNLIKRKAGIGQTRSIQSQPAQPQAQVENNYSSAIAQAKSMVEDRLIDSESARYGKIKIFKTTTKAGDKGAPALLVIGEVNSKNRMGGYVGKVYFGVMLDPNNLQPLTDVYIDEVSEYGISLTMMRFSKAAKRGEEVFSNTANEEQLDEKCWTGYKQVGMKKKGGKEVPNCVPKESAIMKGLTGKRD